MSSLLLRPLRLLLALPMLPSRRIIKIRLLRLTSSTNRRTPRSRPLKHRTTSSSNNNHRSNSNNSGTLSQRTELPLLVPVLLLRRHNLLHHRLTRRTPVHSQALLHCRSKRQLCKPRS